MFRLVFNIAYKNIGSNFNVGLAMWFFSAIIDKRKERTHMKVAAIQMPTVKDKIQNIRTAGTYIEKIKAENPDFVILPEMFCCPYQTENFPVYAEKEGGPSWQAMSDYARKYHIYLIAGSMPEADDVGKAVSYTHLDVYKRQGTQTL